MGDRDTLIEKMNQQNNSNGGLLDDFLDQEIDNIDKIENENNNEDKNNDNNNNDLGIDKGNITEDTSPSTDGNDIGFNMDFTTKSQALDNAIGGKIEKPEEIKKIEKKYNIKKSEDWWENIKVLFRLNLGMYNNISKPIIIFIVLTSIIILFSYFILKDLIIFIISTIYIYALNNYGFLSSYVGLLILIGILTFLFSFLLNTTNSGKLIGFIIMLILFIGLLNPTLFLFLGGLGLMLYSLGLEVKTYSKELGIGFYLFGIGTVLYYFMGYIDIYTALNIIIFGFSIILLINIFFIDFNEKIELEKILNELKISSDTTKRKAEETLNGLPDIAIETEPLDLGGLEEDTEDNIIDLEGDILETYSEKDGIYYTIKGKLLLVNTKKEGLVEINI